MSKKASNPSPPIREQGRVAVSMTEFKIAFTEWDRRYREEPERFMSEAEHLLKETPNTYGDACAPYFMKLINEVKTGEIV
jgi:hypothetical protein